MKMLWGKTKATSSRHLPPDNFLLQVKVGMCVCAISCKIFLLMPTRYDFLVITGSSIAQTFDDDDDGWQLQ